MIFNEMYMRRIVLLVMLLLPSLMFAQQFTEYDRRVFNEGQVLTRGDLLFAVDGTPWSANDPIRIYGIHDEGDETIVTFSYSIYHKSQWVTFSKGIYIKDEDSGDIYKVRGYTDGLSMDRLLIIKDCNGENILVSLRFPKLKRKVRTISIHNPGHKDDIKPSTRRPDPKKPLLASKVDVKKMRKIYKENKVNVYE